ncbi:MAG: hypothetical protein QM535_16260 [Limnohabitans sp.]|nr:hypothetical protein [Limnohabitans sp.]
MKLKIIYYVVLFSFLIISKTNAQDRLEPYNENPYMKYGDYDGLKKYYEHVEKILFQNSIKNSSIRYLVIPNFRKEYSLSFQEDEIVFSTVTNSIWENKDNTDLKVELVEKTKKVDSNNCKSIQILITEFLKESEKPEKVNLGIDGVEHFFMDSSVKAKIWSPKSGSKTYQLIDIMNEIIELVKSDDEIIKFSPELTQKIKKLKH